MLEEGKIYEAEITGYNSDGEGVCRIDGVVCFVPMGVKGDVSQIKITKLFKNYARGEIKDILTFSPDRTAPPCPSYSRCGGCNIMHLSYPAQLEFKKSKVRDALLRIGGFRDLEVKNCVASPEIFEYRNKVSVPIREIDGEICAGFYEGKTHNIAAGGICLLQSGGNMGIVNALIDYMYDNGVTAYNDLTGNGDIRHIYIRCVSGKTMVSVVSRSGKLPNEDKLINAFLDASGNVTSVIINKNDTNSSLILGNNSRAIYGNMYLSDTLLGLNFKIHHDSFYQVNKDVCELLYAHTLSLLGDLSDKSVFDIYCGIGTISLLLAQNAKNVTGIEYLSQATDDARENAELNKLSNTDFYSGDASDVLKELYNSGKSADYVVLDPPRKGCEKGLLETLPLINPEKIVYISCDCAYLARDLKILSEYGYMPQSATPFDMFPQTSHVETVVLMAKEKSCQNR